MEKPCYSNGAEIPLQRRYLGKIKVIKAVRALTRMGLKDSKLIIEDYLDACDRHDYVPSHYEVYDAIGRVLHEELQPLAVELLRSKSLRDIIMGDFVVLRMARTIWKGE